MPLLKRVYECPPSGVPKEEYPNIAATNFHEHYDRPFKFIHCVSILKQLPKFDPESGVDLDAVIAIEDDDEDVAGGEKKPSATNKIGKPMGANMARPIGQKAAKKALAAKPLEEARVTALSNMATAHTRIANMTEVQTNMDLLFTRFKMYKEMGRNEQAEAAMAALEALEEQTRNSTIAAAAIPASATSAFTGEDDEVEILEEDLPGDLGAEDHEAAI
jgi:hypothetical protein